MRGATIWNVTEPSGPGPGHDYVQITLGQSPVTITPPSLSQLMRSKGPEKYKHTLTRCYCHFLTYQIISILYVKRCLAEKEVKIVMPITIFPEKIGPAMPRIPGSAQCGVERDNSVIQGLGRVGRDKKACKPWQICRICVKIIHWHDHWLFLSVIGSQNRVLVKCSWPDRDTILDIRSNGQGKTCTISINDEARYQILYEGRAGLMSGWRLLGYNCH